jgi:hypothetical protein
MDVASPTFVDEDEPAAGIGCPVSDYLEKFLPRKRSRFVEYVENRCIGLGLAILGWTIPKVLGR